MTFKIIQFTFNSSNVFVWRLFDHLGRVSVESVNLSQGRRNWGVEGINYLCLQLLADFEAKPVPLNGILLLIAPSGF